MKIVVVNGTNRQGSLSRGISTWCVEQLVKLGHEAEVLDCIEMGPAFLHPNAYKEPEDSVTDLVNRFMDSDGVIFAVPEYNGSFPGVVKLLIDMLPYPEGFDARPCMFIGIAAGQFAGLRAVEHLQQVAGYRNAHIYPRRTFIADSYKKVSADKGPIDDELGERIRANLSGFLTYIGDLKD